MRGGGIVERQVLGGRSGEQVSENGGRHQHALRVRGRHRQQDVLHERPRGFVEQQKLAAARVDVERATAVAVRQTAAAQPGRVDDATRRETVAVSGDEVMQRCARRLAKFHPGDVRAE